MGFEIGQRVIAAKDIIEEATGDNPQLLLCSAGDILFVRKISARPNNFGMPYAVSHENILDSSFWVAENEIKMEAKQNDPS